MTAFPQNLYSNSDGLALVRNRLITLGFIDHDLTTAVKGFQKANQLVQDGIVGPLTWSRLFTVKIEVTPQSLVLRTRALEIAKTQLFVREKTGHNDGKEVEAYLKTIGLGAGYSWCAAFVYWCFQQASIALGTKNPVTPTGGVLDHWERTHGIKIGHDQVGPGDIFIMDFGGGHGHTGIVSVGGVDRITTIEGNTSADPTLPSEDRDGSGVFERSRKITSIKGFIRY